MRFLIITDNGGEEIDQVLSHARDEDHLSDPKDIPQENLVGRHAGHASLVPLTRSALPYQMERLFPYPQYRRDVLILERVQRLQKGGELRCQGLDRRAGVPPSRAWRSLATISRGVGAVRD